MKSKPNWSEIEGRIDFGQVSQKLTQFAASGAGRRKTVVDLLDKVKDALMQARSNGASYRAMATFLNESGLPVSEPTLRQYLKTQGGGKRPRARNTASNRSEPNTQIPRETQEHKVQPQAQPPQPSDAATRKPEEQPVREPWTPRTRGPRIADPKNL